MKLSIKNMFRMSLLNAALNLAVMEMVSGQTFTTLHHLSFNNDGAYPQAGLVLSGNTLYGTAGSGGSWGAGTVFAIRTDGTGFTNLYNFNAGGRNSSDYYTNTSGAYPWSGLILSGNGLFGMTREGGSSGIGTIFKVNTDGTGFTNLHIFTTSTYSEPLTNSDGAYPRYSLILSGNTLYGTAVSGGNSGSGTVFALNTDGTGFTILHSFTGRDGSRPAGELILSGTMLYGTACQGGTWGNGVVFALRTDGTGFTNLHHFTAIDPSGVNSDGSTPLGGVVLSGNTLYGTAAKGGNSGQGTVFRLGTDGANFATGHHFEGNDGMAPVAGLVQLGNTLYGTAGSGGKANAGALFRVNIDGADFVNLHSFTAVSVLTSTNSDGANPQAGLMVSGNVLYGTAVTGGSSGYGTLFSLLIPPQLKITRTADHVTLAWITNSAGFMLQSTTNLSPAIWTTVSTEPVILDGQNTVTNSIYGRQQQFYRLIH
jgi:uncharacterized repeat protein (TIGR03803 family)